MEILPHQAQPSESLHLVLPDVRVRWTRLKPPAKGSPMLRYQAGDHTCRLVFCLDGLLQSQGEVAASQENLQIASGCCGLVYAQKKCGCLACAGCGDARIVDVWYSRSYLLKLMGANQLVRLLLPGCCRGGPVRTITKITQPMNHILSVMENHAAHGKANPLFVMAKALELMWLFVNSLDPPDRNQVSQADRQAVRDAQAILENNLTTAPSLSELAVRVGMSISKLKQVFPRVCGLPPYGYLRQARMEQAFYMLHNTDMSVTEVALEVGYASPSRFSRAFACQFGFNPSLARHMQ
ncbi:AraC family transcriptional regulator [uncultured Desulfosarcina sp.]|uniref:helix-turn-helix domain-containing protein n=1 Tax=uncultured Desulfosarcina sp. TaxID=218289 RepID=UPI0029C7BD5F|nr:AraC family transcriptional regulator [uncultured Desulfosarcina sp.]